MNRVNGVIVVAALLGCTGSSTNAETPTADAGIDAGKGCPASAPGAWCTDADVGKVCRYPSCPGAVIEATCLFKDFQYLWAQTTLACTPEDYPDAGTRADAS